MGKNSEAARITNEPLRGFADEAAPVAAALPGYRPPAINLLVRAAAESANIEVACDEDRAGR
jgi:hypothetical protein